MNISWNLDIAIFFIFLALNLAVGLYHGRGVKTIEDYALGGRNFSTGALVSTIIATWIGGDYLFITLAEVYKTGLHYTIGCLGMVACLFLNAYVFIPKMQEFLGSISVAESMGKLYGENIRIISAISGTIASAGFIAVQFKVFGEILKNYIGLSGNYPIFIAASIVVVYSAFGGIRSVTFTDIVQFFTFGVLIPVLGFIVWNDYTNISNFTIEQAASSPIFNYQEFLGLSNPKFWSVALLFLLFALPDLNPTMFQRVAIGRTIPQVKKAFTISAFILMFILLGMAWIAFLLHGIDPNLQPTSLVQYIIDQYSPHTGLKSFILIGVVAMCMSTADSNINSSSVLLTHDFCQPLKLKFKNELVLSKIIAIMLGVISIFLALLDYDLLPLVFMTQSFYIPIIDVPLILAILGFRSTTKAVLIGMGAGLIAVIIWRIFFMDLTNVDSIMPGMIVNFIFFIGSHYLLRQPGGWIKDTRRIIKHENKLKKAINFLRNFSFITFCKSNAPRNELTYTGFGLFCIISTICTMYSMSNSFGNKTLLGFYEVMLATSICFMTYPIWPHSLKKETLIQITWNIAILYLLIICSTFFVLLSNFAHLQVTIFILNIVVLAILTRWNVTFFLMLVGVSIAIQFYKHYMGIENINIVIGSTQFVVYNLLLVATAIIIFLKPKQQNEEMEDILKKDMEVREQEQYKNLIRSLQLQVEFVKNLDEGCIKVFESINKQVIELNGRIKNAHTKEEVEVISRDLMDSTDRLQNGARYLSDVIYNVQNLIKIKVSTINLQQLIDDIIKEYSFSYPQVQFLLDIKTKSQEIDCDKYLITGVIKDFIYNIISTTTGSQLVIKIIAEEDMLEYQLSFTKEYTKKINGIKFLVIGLGKELSQAKISSLLAQSYNTVEEMIFSNISLIISAHYGNFYIKNDQEGTIYSFVIPAKINEIRPKTMDLPNAQLDNIDNVVQLSKEMIRKRIIVIARELLKIGLDSQLVAKITRLSKDELEKLIPDHFLNG